MEIIKNNHLLKISLHYNTEYAHDDLMNYAESVGLERLSAYDWLMIDNPDEPHFTPEELKRDDSVIDYLNEVAYNVSESSMPALTDEEFSDLFHAVGWEEWQDVDMEVARRGLLSLTHAEWWGSLNHEYGDLTDTLAPYTYMARGDSQGDFARLCLIGTTQEEAESIVKDFEVYAFTTPCGFHVDLIDCESGNTIDQESLGGIYDDTANLTHLKAELSGAIRGMGIDSYLLVLALEAVQGIDHADIKY